MNKNGSIIFSLLLIVVLTILGAAILARSANESRIALRGSNSTQAFWLSEAGVQRSVWEINHNNCADFVQEGTATACTNCTSCGGGNKTMAGTISGAGDYDVVLNNANTSVTSTGSVPSRTDTGKITRSVQASISSAPLFGYAVFTKGSITLANSSSIDSYNSSNGAYNVAGNVGSNGNVGTNGTSNGIITMTNSSTIKGDASTGTNGTVTTVNSSSVTGSVSHDNNVSLPDVSVPSDLSGLSSSGSINLSGSGTQTISSGSYKYAQINLSNSSQLNISGDVKLYVTGASAVNLANSTSINISSGSSLTLYTGGAINLSNSSVFNNVSHAPANLTIYSSVAGGSGMTLANSTTLYGAVYMPNADMSISNSVQIYGAVVAKSLSMPNSSKIHYDQALSSMNNPFDGSSGGSISNWQEI